MKTEGMTEQRYAKEMIEHHKMAVQMSSALLRDGKLRPRIKAFAEKVIEAQSKEIEWLQEWLKGR
jgi:uncharacterized protein (DUF305 family)